MIDYCGSENMKVEMKLMFTERFLLMKNKKWDEYFLFPFVYIYYWKKKEKKFQMPNRIQSKASYTKNKFLKIMKKNHILSILPLNMDSSMIGKDLDKKKALSDRCSLWKLGLINMIAVGSSLAHS